MDVKRQNVCKKDERHGEKKYLRETRLGHWPTPKLKKGKVIKLSQVELKRLWILALVLKGKKKSLNSSVLVTLYFI